MKVVTIIQARMQSTRLPGKVLAPIADKPMLWHVVERAKRARYPVVVATGRHVSNDPIATLCRKHCWPCYRGSDENVLERVYSAASAYEADFVMRITADCPLIEPRLIQRAVYVEAHIAPDAALITNSPCEVTGYPDGVDVELMPFAALHETYMEAEDPFDLEHVTSWLRKRGSVYFIRYDGPPIPRLKWSVDTQDELDWVRSVYDGIGGTNFCMKKVVKWLSQMA